MTDRSWYYTVRFRLATPVAAWPEEFVVVTGWATTGERWSEAENLAANSRLEAELACSGRWQSQGKCSNSFGSVVVLMRVW
jgi:hypothetical protein